MITWLCSPEAAYVTGADIPVDGGLFHYNWLHHLYGDAATEQSLAVLRRLDALPVALEKTYAERVLQIRDRSRNRRLGRVQAPCRLPHAAELHGGHENVQVVQLHAASDPITDLHGSPHIETAMV